MRLTREDHSSVSMKLPPGWVVAVFFFIFVVQTSVPVFALRAVTPAESTVFLRNRLQQDSPVPSMPFSGMEEDVALRHQAALQFNAYETALKLVGGSQQELISRRSVEADSAPAITHLVHNGLYLTQSQLIHHDRDEISLRQPAGVSFSDLGVSDPGQLVMLDETEILVIPETGSGRTIATADHHFCLFIAMLGIMVGEGQQPQLVQWHLHAGASDTPGDLASNLEAGVLNLLEHLHNGHRMHDVTVVVSADPEVAKLIVPEHLQQQWQSQGVQRVAFFPRQQNVNLSTVVNRFGIGALLHSPQAGHSLDQLENSPNFHFISWNGLSTGVYQTLNHAIDPVSSLFQQITIAPDQRKVWVIQASVLAQRHDLEVLISRMPSEMADLILFGEGSVTAHELAARRQIRWVNSNNPQALMPELNQHPNQTVVFLGEGSASAELSRLISGDRTLIVLEPSVELPDLLLSFGVAQPLLQRIDWQRLRASLEEVTFS